MLARLSSCAQLGGNGRDIPPGLGSCSVSITKTNNEIMLDPYTVVCRIIPDYFLPVLADRSDEVVFIGKGFHFSLENYYVQTNNEYIFFFDLPLIYLF